MIHDPYKIIPESFTAIPSVERNEAALEWVAEFGELDALAVLMRATARHPRIGFDVPAVAGMDAATLGQVLAEGALLGRYRFDMLQSKPNGCSPGTPAAAHPRNRWGSRHWRSGDGTGHRAGHQHCPGFVQCPAQPPHGRRSRRDCQGAGGTFRVRGGGVRQTAAD